MTERKLRIINGNSTGKCDRDCLSCILNGDINAEDFRKESVMDKYLGSVVRHVGSAIGGFLVAKGLPQEIADPLTQSILGALLYGGTQLWSLKLKKKLEKYF